MPTCAGLNVIPVDDVHGTRGRDERTDERHDLVVDVMERVFSRSRAGTPHRAMNRRATLAEANERRAMAIVVAPDVSRVETRNHSYPSDPATE